MNTLHKILLAFIALFVAGFAGIWLFNHVNPWIGIAAILLIIYAICAYAHVAIRFIKQLNKNKKQ